VKSRVVGGQELNVLPRTLESTKLFELVCCCDGGGIFLQSTLLVTSFIPHPSRAPELPALFPWMTSFTWAVKVSFLKVEGWPDLSSSSVEVVPL